MDERDETAQPVRPKSADEPTEPRRIQADASDELLVLARLLSEDSDVPKREPEEPDDGADDRAQGEEYLVAGRFEIVAPLGSGPEGSVYRARDHDNQKRETALKILTRDAVDASGADDRLARARELLSASAKLDARFIARTREAGRTDDGRVWLASDLVEGESARALADRAGALPPRHALEIVHQILQGLEKGHAAGVAHGQLRAENVLLAKRVEWTEANPFGVGVRLTDYGLSGIVHGRTSRSSEEAVRADLLAVGVLLAELLTGMRSADDGTDWIGSGASTTTSAMSPRARRLIDTALSRDPSERFADAGAFRSALESTEEWRPRDRSRGRQLIAIALAAAGAAWLVPRLFERQEIAAAPPTKVGPAQDDDARKRLESDLARVNELVAATQAELDSERSVGAAARIQAEQAEAGSRRTRVESAARERELSATLARMRGQLRKFEESTPAATVPVESPVRPAPTDELVRALREGNVALARGYATSIEHAISSNDRSAAPASFGHTLVDAADAVDRVAHTLDPWEGMQLSSATRRMLERVRGEADDAAAITPWRGRRAALETLFAELEGRLTIVEAERERELEARWAQYESDPDRAPTEVLRLADYFRDGRLPGFLVRYANWVSERTEPNGLVDWNALSELTSLEAWNTFVESSSLEPADAALAAAGVTIRTLAYAARFGAASEGSFPRYSDAERAAFDAARVGWREELALRAELLTDGGALSPVGSSYLYISRAAGGEVTWRWDVWGIDPDPPNDSEASRLLTQSFYDEAGVLRGERKLHILRIGRKIFEEGVRRDELLDLGDTSRVLEIRHWSMDGFPQPPPSLGIGLSDLESFRARLNTARPRCLVVPNGTELRWWTPELGLVRHADSALITVELVYATGF